jgi:membrane protein implicated in regulation of membrane protease activity
VIPLLWLIAGVVLIAVELVSGTFVLLMLGLAALAGAGASALGAPLGVDVAVFGVSAAALVLLARPALQRRMRGDGAPVNAGPRALLGATAEVVEEITGDDPGTVRIAGALWTARALHDGPDGPVLTPGDPVVVVDIRGATAVVTARAAGPAQPSRPPLQGGS